MAPNNPSAWNYLRGCVCANSLHRKLEPVLPFRESDAIALEYLRTTDHAAAAADPACDEAGETPPGALEWLLESALESYSQGGDSTQAKLVRLCLQLFTRLRHADPARERYWQYRERALRN